MIHFQFPGLEHIHCVFTGRNLEDKTDSLAGNISFMAGQERAETERNRKALKERLAAIGMRDWRECHQVHGDRIIINPEAGRAEPPQADGMTSDAHACGLLIKTADCQPLLFAEKSGKYIMAIHAGWRGNRINFPGKAVRTFCDIWGVPSRDILVVRGPSLGPGKAEFVNFEKEWGPQFEPWFDRKSRRMDLWQLSRNQLMEAGVPEGQIYGIDICTAANDKLFFSYRTNRQCGRQGSLIWMEEDAP